MEDVKNARRKLDGWKAYSEKAGVLDGLGNAVNSVYKEANEERNLAEQQKADAAKLKTDAEKIIIALEEKAEKVEKKKKDMEEKLTLYKLADKHGVVIAFNGDGLQVMGEGAANYVAEPEVVPYNVLIIDEEAAEKYEEKAPAAPLPAKPEDVKPLSPYLEEGTKEQGFDVVEETVIVEKTDVPPTEEKAKPGPPEKKKVEEAEGYRTKDIINFLLELDKNEKSGKDFTEIRDKTNLALGVSGKERRNRFDEAKMEYQTAMEERLLSDPHLRLGPMANYELREPEDEEEGEDTFMVGEHAHKKGTDFKRVYMPDNADEPIGAIVAEIAKKKGFDDIVLTSDGCAEVWYNTNDEDEKKRVNKFVKELSNETSNSWPMQEELNDKEYRILMNSDEENAFGNLLRSLDEEGKVVHPTFWRDGHKIAYSLPKIIFKEMREEAKRLQKGGANAYEVGRMTRRFNDEGRAGLYAKMMSRSVKGSGGKADVKKMGKDYAVTVVFDSTLMDADAVKNVDLRFDEEDRNVTLTPEAYEVLIKKPKGDWFADYVKSEDKAGRVKEQFLSDSKKLIVPFGAYQDVLLEVKSLDANMEILLPEARRKRVDHEEVKRKLEEHMERKEEILLGKERPRRAFPERPDGKGKKRKETLAPNGYAEEKAVEVVDMAEDEAELPEESKPDAPKAADESEE